MTNNENDNVDSKESTFCHLCGENATIYILYNDGVSRYYCTEHGNRKLQNEAELGEVEWRGVIDE